MRCGIVKWLAASDRNLPRPARRHLDRCPSCRDFVQEGRALAGAAKRDAALFLAEMPSPKSGGLFDRMLGEVRSPSAPVRVAAKFWIPASVAAGLVFVALVVFRSGAVPPAPSWSDLVAPVKSFPFPGEVLGGLAVEAESPLDREYRSLERALASAAQSLKASLDLGLPSPRPPIR